MFLRYQSLRPAKISNQIHQILLKVDKRVSGRLKCSRWSLMFLFVLRSFLLCDVTATYLLGRGPCGGSWWPPPAGNPGWGAAVWVGEVAGGGGGQAGWWTEED